MAPKRKPMAVNGEEVPKLPQDADNNTKKISEFQRMKDEIEKISVDHNLESYEE